MVNFRTFRMSDEFYSYYRTQIDLDEVNSMEEIVERVRLHLIHDLNNLGLEILAEKAKNKHFDTHGYTFEEVLLSESNKEFYICGHH
jgi:hypothetical protein